MLTKMICPAGMHCPAGSDHAPDLVGNACITGHYCLRGDEVGSLTTFMSRMFVGDDIDIKTTVKRINDWNREEVLF